ncbi:arginase family protein [Actinacidiphila acidipaludis]|uniref:Arginase family protein n=1 Tax=Actinacidiphila acidipaludis TaxID=2873382 RepID=A0ABS7QIE4_9ACTN|nr:arginase family protein [Streptomyces acidipaludis]MBY8882738.1 arginase family protein [Streptomyces acidipaludis]
MRRRLVLMDAPSNLGLRPPAEGVVPGCYKLAGALRDQRLRARLGAEEGGVVVPPRYDRGNWKPGDGVFNAAAIAGYTRRLADRIETHVRAGEFPVVLGGDCSIQLGASLALRRAGRYGIAVIDGSADFRHPGNSPHVGAAGGEELALATGRGQADLTDIEGLRPYLRESDVRVLGIRDYDTERDELTACGIASATVGEIRAEGAEQAAGAALRTLESPELAGFWVHLDADVLDPSVMPAVDSPDDGGLMPGELASLLRTLVRSERCVGLNLTIYDPDLDPDGTGAALLAELLVSALVHH